MYKSERLGERRPVLPAVCLKDKAVVAWCSHKDAKSQDKDTERRKSTNTQAPKTQTHKYNHTNIHKERRSSGKRAQVVMQPRPPLPIPPVDLSISYGPHYRKKKKTTDAMKYTHHTHRFPQPRMARTNQRQHMKIAERRFSQPRNEKNETAVS